MRMHWAYIAYGNLCMRFLIAFQPVQFFETCSCFSQDSSGTVCNITAEKIYDQFNVSYDSDDYLKLFYIYKREKREKALVDSLIMFVFPLICPFLFHCLRSLRKRLPLALCSFLKLRYNVLKIGQILLVWSTERATQQTLDIIGRRAENVISARKLKGRNFQMDLRTLHCRALVVL